VDRGQAVACAISALMLAGVILSLAASPPVATRIGVDPFHFFSRPRDVPAASFMVLIAVSFMSPKAIRRSALLVSAVSHYPDRGDAGDRAGGQGSRRWITLRRRQHPGFRLRKARFRGDRGVAVRGIPKRPEMPATSMAIVLALDAGVAIGDGADFGQTMLIPDGMGAAVPSSRAMRMIWVAGLAGAAAAGLFGAYLLVPHVAGRIKRFMNPASGDTFRSTPRWKRSGTAAGSASARRRHRQCAACRTPYDFRVRGRGRRIRHHTCAGAGRAVAFTRDPHALRAYQSEDMFSRFAALGLAILSASRARSTWRSTCN